MKSWEQAGSLRRHIFLGGKKITLCVFSSSSLKTAASNKITHQSSSTVPSKLLSEQSCQLCISVWYKWPLPLSFIRKGTENNTKLYLLSRLTFIAHNQPLFHLQCTKNSSQTQLKVLRWRKLLQACCQYELQHASKVQDFYSLLLFFYNNHCSSEREKKERISAIIKSR